MKAFAKVVQVIEVRDTIGKGNEADPIRQVVHYFNFAGQHLATRDPATWYESGPSDLSFPSAKREGE